MFEKKVVQLFIATIIIHVITSSATVSTKKHHYARSSKDLRELAQLDFATISQLKGLTNTSQEGSSLLENVESYLDEFAEATGALDVTNITHHVDNIVRNPLSIFKLIQRVAYFLNDMQDEPVGIPDLPLAELAEEHKGTVPLRDDMTDFANAILRIQFVHDLNVTDLAAGKVYGRETGTRLTAADCYFIGMIAKSGGQNALAVEWLKKAERLAEMDDTIDVYTVQSKLLSMVHAHDRPGNAQPLNEAHFFTKPLISLDSMKRKNQKVRNILYEKYAGKGRNCSYWDVNYWGLCGGAKLQSPEASSHLFCWLEFKIHKMFAIGPLKMEFLSRNPDIVQIYDAFSETQVAEMVTQEGELKPSLIVDLTNTTGITSSVRSQRISSSKNLGLRDVAETRMNRKVEATTGLRSTQVSAKEQTQVINYVAGGHYTFHVDALLEEHAYGARGDRAATFMVYLNDVDAGGYTVFPTALVSAVPTKGSAVYWFNTFSDGSPDFSTTHAGCPVVLGEKWISNKWIRFYDQFSVRKCTLNPKERFQIPVNGKFLPVPGAFRHKLMEEQEIQSCRTLPAVDESRKTQYDGRGYTYTLIPSLKALILLDWKIYQTLKHMFTTKPDSAAAKHDGTVQIFDTLQTYFQSFNESAYKALESEPRDKELVDKLAWNPLAIYRTFWRFENCVKPWLATEIQERHGTFKHFLDYLQTAYDVSEGPSETDLVEAINGILRAQHIYNLKSKDIAKGLMAGTDAGIVLTAEQCIQIGDLALASQFYYQAVEWMETAIHKITFEGDASATLETAKKGLETVKNMHDLLLGKLDDDEKFYASPVSAVSDRSARQTRIEQSYNDLKLKNESILLNRSLASTAHTNYWGICQGRPHQSPAEKSKLFCWHETKVHPYWKIGPLRAEFLSLHDKAEVVQYHDILTATAVAFLRNGTNRKQHVAEVNQGTVVKGNKYVIKSDSRLSTISWLPLNRSTETIRFANLVKRVTGLDVLGHAQSILQMATYGPGGHYDVHTDSDRYEEDLHLARIGTLMFYLSDVPEGGGTAFSQAGVHVTPKKGSAIFWPTLLRAGEIDEDTWHGACPVIFGEKIVATQWIMYSRQHHLQCHTDRTKRYEVVVNGRSKYDMNYSLKH